MTNSRQIPFLYETPAEVLRSRQQRVVAVGDRRFYLTLPQDTDDLLDHPAIHSAFEADEYLPYWAEIWPSALMLGEALLTEPWPQGSLALEIGCGLGLAGLTALSLGMRVIFSDYDAAALQFAAENAAMNGFDQFDLCQIDWRHPPPDLQVPLILAADVIYEARNVEPLVALMTKLLLPGGACWLVDPNRSYAEDFRAALTQSRLAFETTARQVTPPGQKTVHGTLYRIRQERS
ncbi:class I SAM-dependent methyltransferase [Sphaerothrix gracilis]|uniref:class I SAM-dependent methyltransferase n=1 Tax=Sphaerothrix gracilis TaxID=3151835 RepID=UPI0031FCE2E0